MQRVEQDPRAALTRVGQEASRGIHVADGTEDHRFEAAPQTMIGCGSREFTEQRGRPLVVVVENGHEQIRRRQSLSGLEHMHPVLARAARVQFDHLGVEDAHSVVVQRLPGVAEKSRTLQQLEPAVSWCLCHSESDCVESRRRGVFDELGRRHVNRREV